METPKPTRFELIAGHPAVDFVNTVGGLRPARSREKLNTFNELLGWATQAGVLSAAEGRRLGREAAARPHEAAQALERARAFREVVHRLFRAIADHTRALDEDLAAFEGEVQRAWEARRLRPSEHGYVWEPPPAEDLDTVVPRLALAAEELLTGDLARKVRVCEAVHSGECGWLYLDQTRNHSRRWCEMGSCGNRHKARRHYARVRGRA
ncbi:MAG TPA: ABATE domain-containing protein [Myxococcaceae bacterium]|nr:ABATE domain-containing protein [Myxococcaceae bacterium]